MDVRLKTDHDTRDPKTSADRPITVTRRRVDRLLTIAGFAVAVVMLLAGALLTWGSDFAEDYVGDELAAQNITFPSADSLAGQGREDLVPHAGELVDTGSEAEAYASYIDGHLEDIGGGMRYSEIPDRDARAAVQSAIDEGASDAEVAELQATADELTEQRETLFKGEMLRGALLNAYAWSTLGRIAGIAATVAFVGAAVMTALSAAGALRLRKLSAS